ncbi:hypothetical protein [Metallosphaera javensis (ex Hofmann et al. 2022)]|uniref:hypothetical protein n=1 Tax=Metallosphaera javensis (ex Hofmann et al. 2022) TaxID=99938 RepID=UPI001EDDAD15|nr:hypothetical protein [Metallosphaera javensis (ex Hofmann et al. 2022)]
MRATLVPLVLVMLEDLLVESVMIAVWNQAMILRNQEENLAGLSLQSLKIPINQITCLLKLIEDLLKDQLGLAVVHPRYFLGTLIETPVDHIFPSADLWVERTYFLYLSIS